MKQHAPSSVNAELPDLTAVIAGLQSMELKPIRVPLLWGMGRHMPTKEEWRSGHVAQTATAFSALIREARLKDARLTLEAGSRNIPRYRRATSRWLGLEVLRDDSRGAFAGRFDEAVITDADSIEVGHHSGGGRAHLPIVELREMSRRRPDPASFVITLPDLAHMVSHAELHLEML